MFSSLCWWLLKHPQLLRGKAVASWSSSNCPWWLSVLKSSRRLRGGGDAESPPQTAFLLFSYTCPSSLVKTLFSTQLWFGESVSRRSGDVTIAGHYRKVQAYFFIYYGYIYYIVYRIYTYRKLSCTSCKLSSPSHPLSVFSISWESTEQLPPCLISGTTVMSSRGTSLLPLK